MFRSWGEACIKGRAVTLTGFDAHRCAEKPTSEAEGWRYREFSSIFAA